MFSPTGSHSFHTLFHLVLLVIKVSILVNFEIKQTSFCKDKIILYFALIISFDERVHLWLWFVRLRHSNYGVNLVVCDDDMVFDQVRTILAVAQCLRTPQYSVL